MPDVGNTRARYRRILRFAARYIVQTWWYELVLPKFGLARVAARGRTRHAGDSLRCGRQARCQPDLGRAPPRAPKTDECTRSWSPRC